MLDRSTARVVLRMLARNMSKGTVAELCETSISSIDRVRQYSERHNGAVRDPQPGKGKQGDHRWHFGGAMGLSSAMLLDRVARAWTRPRSTRRSTMSTATSAHSPRLPSLLLLRTCANWASRPSGSARGTPRPQAVCSRVPTNDAIHRMLSACGLRSPGRWLQNNRKGLEGLSAHEQMRLVQMHLVKHTASASSSDQCSPVS